MKKFKQIILVLICIILLSGCAKEHITMTINKNKSINFEMEMLLSDKLKDTEEGQNNFSQLKDQLSTLEKKGFTVTPKTKDGYSGYLVTRNIDSIDDLANNKGNPVSLSEISTLYENLLKSFKVKKGFLYNTYTSSFFYEYSEDVYNASNESTIIPDNENTNDTENNVINNEETTLLEPANELVPTTEAVATDDTTSNETNTLFNEMELTYVVNLPYKVDSNNAGKVSDNGKTLTWNIISNGKTSIEYSFPIYNLTNIIICGVGALVLIVIIIVIIKSLTKKKEETKETLIHTDYDSSIVGQIGEATIPQDDIPQGPTNHEFSLPGEPQVNVTQEATPETPTMMGLVESIPVMPQATVTPQTTVTQGPVPSNAPVSETNNLNQ